MSKGPGVQKMFDGIASDYDQMNRVMTMGQDQKWRRFVVQCLWPIRHGLWLLDRIQRFWRRVIMCLASF